jgi:hypothetical protein
MSGKWLVSNGISSKAIQSASYKGDLNGESIIKNIGLARVKQQDNIIANALKNPETYLENRTKALTELENDVKVAYKTYFENFSNQGLPDSVSNEKASEVVKAIYNAGIDDINLKYPTNLINNARTGMDIDYNSNNMWKLDTIAKTHTSARKPRKHRPKKN